MKVCMVRQASGVYTSHKIFSAALHTGTSQPWKAFNLTFDCQAAQI